MDVIAESIEDAKVNVPDGIYEVGTAETVVPKWVAEGLERPPWSLIRLDGAGRQVADTIIATQPEKMVYVSCNVSTLARDLVKLASVYDVKYIQSVDMFRTRRGRSSCEVGAQMIEKAN